MSFLSLISHASIFLHLRILLPVFLFLLSSLSASLFITIFITTVAFFYHQKPTFVSVLFLNADTALYSVPLAFNLLSFSWIFCPFYLL